jgi:hypothetical protein
MQDIHVNGHSALVCHTSVSEVDAGEFSQAVTLVNVHGYGRYVKVYIHT